MQLFLCAPFLPVLIIIISPRFLSTSGRKSSFLNMHVLYASKPEPSCSDASLLFLTTGYERKLAGASNGCPSHSFLYIYPYINSSLITLGVRCWFISTMLSKILRWRTVPLVAYHRHSPLSSTAVRGMSTACNFFRILVFVLCTAYIFVWCSLHIFVPRTLYGQQQSPCP